MRGLKQAEKIAYEDLKQHLNPYGYAPTKHTMTIETRRSRPYLRIDSE